jgi:hypothetical protein
MPAQDSSNQALHAVQASHASVDVNNGSPQPAHGVVSLLSDPAESDSETLCFFFLGLFGSGIFLNLSCLTVCFFFLASQTRISDLFLGMSAQRVIGNSIQMCTTLQRMALTYRFNRFI